MHDSNADGKIDANDGVFSQLRVWRDLDQDGRTDAGELFTLNELGIASIGLTSSAANAANAGNTIIALDIGKSPNCGTDAVRAIA
jgi:hypothetical protein